MESIKNLFIDFKVKLRIKYYNFKKLFIPYNVIKLTDLDNINHDADVLMFHSIRQIFIDFIELEKPFLNFFDERKSTNDRYTNLEEMQDYINNLTEKKKEFQKIFNLYKWFKIDYEELLVDLKDNNYNFEKLKKLQELENKKLIEIIKLREHLWD